MNNKKQENVRKAKKKKKEEEDGDLDEDRSDILVGQGEKANKKKRKDSRFLKLSKWEACGNIYENEKDS